MTVNKNKQKYRYTKQLVRIALEQGYTSAEILVKAGLSKSSTAQFSKWRHGKALATIRQLQHFINEYEHLLKRRIEHLFYELADGKLNFFKLNGETILKHVIRHPPIQTGKRLTTVALLRIVLLKEGNKYHLILQTRAGLNRKVRFDPSSHLKNLIHSSNEEANWFAYEYVTEMSAKHALESVDAFIHELTNDDNLPGIDFSADAISLLFIVRQSLLKQGYQCQDIIDLAAKETIMSEPKQPEECFNS